MLTANVLLEHFWSDLCLDTVLFGHIACGLLLFLLCFLNLSDLGAVP